MSKTRRADVMSLVKGASEGRLGGELEVKATNTHDTWVWNVKRETGNASLCLRQDGRERERER